MQWAIPIVQGRIPISCRCITDLNLHLLLIPRSVYGCCFTQSLFAFIPRFQFPVSLAKSRHLQSQISYVLDFISRIFPLHSHSTDDVHVFSMIFTVFGQLNPTHRHQKKRDIRFASARVCSLRSLRSARSFCRKSSRPRTRLRRFLVPNIQKCWDLPRDMKI